MKRDMNLIRELLLRLEESKAELYVSNLQVDGYSDEEIGYSAYLLIDGGLAEGKKSTIINQMADVLPVAKTLTNLTWDGHEFCASIKNELSTGQKINGVPKGLGIEIKVKDDITEEIKTKTKNAFR